MLAIKRSVGVTPEVNLRNPLHSDTVANFVIYIVCDVDEEACKQRIHETQGRCHQNSQIGLSVTLQRGLMYFKFLFKK